MAYLDSRDFEPCNDTTTGTQANSSSSQTSTASQSTFQNGGDDINSWSNLTIDNIDISKIPVPKQGETTALGGISIDEEKKCFDLHNRTRRKRFYFKEVSREEAWKACLIQWEQWVKEVNVIKVDHKGSPLPCGITFRTCTGYSFRIKHRRGRRVTYTIKRFHFKNYKTKEDALHACIKAKKEHHEQAQIRKAEAKTPTIVRKDCLDNELPEGLQFQGNSKKGTYTVQFSLINVFSRFSFNSNLIRRCKFSTPHDAYKKALKLHTEALLLNPKKYNYVYLRPSLKRRQYDDASRYKHCQQGANSRNLTFNISFEQFKEIIQKNCSHCNVSPAEANISLDRISCWNDYLVTTVLPSCSYDNLARGVNSVLVYYGHLMLIVKNCLQVTVQLPNSYSEGEKKEVLSAAVALRIWKNNENAEIRNLKDAESLKTMFNRTVRNPETNRYKWEISIEAFTVAIQRNCTYCDRSPKEVNIGIDRVDAEQHHTMTNCCSCCGNCNALKGVEHYEDVVNHAVKVLTFQGFTICGNPSLKPILPLSEVMKGDVKKYLEILSKPRLPKILKRKRPAS